MTISAVPGQSRSIRLLTSKEDWLATIEATCGERRAWQREYTGKRFAKFAKWVSGPL